MIEVSIGELEFRGLTAREQEIAAWSFETRLGELLSEGLPEATARAVPTASATLPGSPSGPAAVGSQAAVALVRALDGGGKRD